MKRARGLPIPALAAALSVMLIAVAACEPVYLEGVVLPGCASGRLPVRGDDLRRCLRRAREGTPRTVDRARWSAIPRPYARSARAPRRARPASPRAAAHAWISAPISTLRSLRRCMPGLRGLHGRGMHVPAGPDVLPVRVREPRERSRQLRRVQPPVSLGHGLLEGGVRRGVRCGPDGVRRRVRGPAERPRPLWGVRRAVRGRHEVPLRDLHLSTGKGNCAGACVDLSSDPAHCGACGAPCPGATVCSSGTCQPTCAPGEVSCGGACVDRSTSSDHCGACGIPCTGGRYCSGGACVCPAGSTLCGGFCVDLKSSWSSCGDCGVTCAPTEVCAAGKCVDECPPGQEVCRRAAAFRSAATT